MATMATVEGKVQRVNGKGFQLAGRDGWLNISKFANELDCPMPKVGDVVRLTLDKSGFIREIAPAPVVDAPATMQASTPTEDSTPVQTEPPTKDRVITRLAVLNTATAILSSGGRAADGDAVMALAARLEQWATR